MEFEHKSGIYMCTCSGNNKSYIGQAKDVKTRKCEHLSELRGGIPF
jgi:predicted GIY-YIG superfamily endonuclease